MKIDVAGVNVDPDVAGVDITDADIDVTDVTDNTDIDVTILPNGIDVTDVDVTYVGSWFDHPWFIEANAANVAAALAKLPPALSPAAKIVFTAHSIPQPMAERSRYREQLLAASRWRVIP